MLKVSRGDIEVEEVEPFPVEDRFIKLPILSYTSLLGIEPIKPQKALINALNNPNYRFVTSCLSRRVGKTYISNIIGQLISLVPGSSILIISPNYGLSQISWELQLQLLKRFEIELERSNAKDKVIELKNGSSIRIGSVAQADSVVGRSYDLIIFDEAALNEKGDDVFNVQLRPTLDKPNSKVVFISTPRGKNWFYKYFRRGFHDDYPEWCSIHCDYKENPRADEKDILEAKKTMSDATFRQEYLAEFVALEGRIYDLSQEQVVDVDPSKIEVQDVIAGLDLGFRDPTAMLVVLTDGVNYYVTEEYYKSENSTKTHAQVVKSLEDKWDIDFIYIDSAAQQTKFDFAQQYDISTINAKKSVLDGIGYVASIIDNDRLFIDHSCENLLLSLDNYRWDTREGLTREKPLHDYSHLPDALRYALYSHSLNVEELET